MKKCGIAPVAQTEATPQEKRRESHAGWNAARMCTQTEAQKNKRGFPWPRRLLSINPVVAKKRETLSLI
jgi:hypothetical protein